MLCNENSIVWHSRKLKNCSYEQIRSNFDIVAGPLAVSYHNLSPLLIWHVTCVCDCMCDWIKWIKCFSHTKSSNLMYRRWDRLSPLRSGSLLPSSFRWIIYMMRERQRETPTMARSLHHLSSSTPPPYPPLFSLPHHSPVLLIFHFPLSSLSLTLLSLSTHFPLHQTHVHVIISDY